MELYNYSLERISNFSDLLKFNLYVFFFYCDFCEKVLNFI